MTAGALGGNHYTGA